MGDGHGGDRRTALGWLACGGTLAALFAGRGRAAAGNEDVDLKKVPAAVMAAATRLVPKATWHAAVKVVEGDQTAYELDGTDGKGRDVTVTVTADGKAVEWETELKKPGNVPEKVLVAVKARWPKFEPTQTHHIRQGKDLRDNDDGDHLYDLRGTIAKGRHVEVQASAAGAILESVVEVPADKVPAAVTAALKKARPKFEVETVYAIRDEKELIGYHFEGKGPKGRDRTISVSPDGKQVEVVE